MKSIFFYLMTLVVITACKRTEEIKLAEPPKELILNISQSVDGDLNQFIIAKNERIKVTFTKNEDNYSPGIDFEIPIRFVFTHSTSLKVGRGFNDYGPDLELDFLDKDGKLIDIQWLGRVYMKETYIDLANFIKSGNNREEWLTFKGSYNIFHLNDKSKSFEDTKSFIDQICKATSIRVKSTIIEETFDESPDDEVDPFEKSSNGDSDCDKFLDDYEDYVLDYVNVAKKAQSDPTNTTYMSEMTRLSKKASEIEGSLEDCKNNAKVAARLAKLQLKMSNAMLN